MLSQLPKDIVPIIYKYIHRFKLDECNQEYRIKFMPRWDETYNYFSYSYEYIYLLLNYRKLGNFIKSDYVDIHNMFEGGRVASLPKNY